MKNRQPREHSLLVKAFRTYLQFVNSGLYFRKEHVIGLENVPANGTPLVIVSNHQNCLNDPLCVCLQLTDRRMNFLARANVFNNPFCNKALRGLGLLPAYRMGYEGLAAVRKNQQTFEDAEESLNNGETVMLYPEGGHQDKRWLGSFKLGYLRIAFSAAEKMNFEKDIMILPSCNHYSNYFHARTDMVIKFAKPISLKPYYERYQEAPRETMMEVNKIVHETIKGMMLHVDDLENYDAIDFIRENGYGKRYAKKNGFKANFLPSRLLSDQKLVDALQKAHQADPEQMQTVYDDTVDYAKALEELKIRDWMFERGRRYASLVVRALILLVLLPFFLVSIIPTGLLFLLPRIFLKKLIKDQMFVSSFNVAVSAFISVPLCLFVPAIILWCMLGFWWALGYMVAFPIMFILVWNYIRMSKKFAGLCRFVSKKNRPAVKKYKKLRSSIFQRLDNILK